MRHATIKIELSLWIFLNRRLKRKQRHYQSDVKYVYNLYAHSQLDGVLTVRKCNGYPNCLSQEIHRLSLSFVYLLYQEAYISV